MLQGFKLPSLFALGFPLIANPDLLPERSRTSDAGLAWTSENKALQCEHHRLPISLSRPYRFRSRIVHQRQSRPGDRAGRGIRRVGANRAASPDRQPDMARHQERRWGTASLPARVERCGGARMASERGALAAARWPLFRWFHRFFGAHRFHAPQRICHARCVGKLPAFPRASRSRPACATSPKSDTSGRSARPSRAAMCS